MSLKEKLQEDLKNAMKAKDSVKLEVVRSVVTGIKTWKCRTWDADDTDVLHFQVFYASHHRPYYFQFNAIFGLHGIL